MTLNLMDLVKFCDLCLSSSHLANLDPEQENLLEREVPKMWKVFIFVVFGFFILQSLRHFHSNCLSPVLERGSQLSWKEFGCLQKA